MSMCIIMRNITGVICACAIYKGCCPSPGLELPLDDFSRNAPGKPPLVPIMMHIGRREILPLAPIMMFTRRREKCLLGFIMMPTRRGDKHHLRIYYDSHWKYIPD